MEIFEEQVGPGGRSSGDPTEQADTQPSDGEKPQKPRMAHPTGGRPGQRIQQSS